MFFTPLSAYLQALVITLVVEVGLFIIFINKKPLPILASVSFNLLSHLSLHLFFHFAVVWGLYSRILIFVIGEALVVLLEGYLYCFARIIPKAGKAFLWALLLNIASILAGFAIGAIV